VGFFLDIKSFFGNQSAGNFDPAGRYLAFVIKAIADKDPSFFEDLFPISGRALRCSTEFHFSVDGKKRRADLAIFHNHEAEPRWLVEIKVHDNKKTDRMTAQFEHYEKWAASGEGRKVFIISPLGLPQEEYDKILAKPENMNIIDLSKARRFKKSTPAKEMFSEFLLDSGYVMKPLPSGDFPFFLHFLVNAFLPHVHLQSVKAGQEKVREGPRVFCDVANNFQVFATQFLAPYLEKNDSQTSQIKAKKKRVPVVRYVFLQFYENGKGTTERSSDLSDAMEFGKLRSSKLGGAIHCFGSSKLASLTTLRFGVRVEIGLGTPQRKQKLSFGAYVMLVKDRKIIAEVEKRFGWRKNFPGVLQYPDEAQKIFQNLLLKLPADVQNHKNIRPNVKRSLVAELNKIVKTVAHSNSKPKSYAIHT